MRLSGSSLDFNPPPPHASGGAATVMGIRISYRGSMLRRRVIEKGDRVETTLLFSGPTKLFHIDHTVSPPVVTELVTAQTLSHARGKATVTFVNPNK